jgi:hypothetical protein
MFDLLEGVLEFFGELVLELLSRGLIEFVNQIREIFR